jgi:hypothetical protein
VSTCNCGKGHHHPDCPLWDSHADNYDQLARKVASPKKKSKKVSSKIRRRARAQKSSTPERGNKKTVVIAMMKRANGATLAAIMDATGWQAHTARVVSVLGSKGAEKIESERTRVASAQIESSGTNFPPDQEVPPAVPPIKPKHFL